MKTFLLVILVTGCGVQEFPRQEEAMKMVWDFYGQKDTPPPITWVTSLNCHFIDNQVYDGWRGQDGRCHAGEGCSIGYFGVTIARPINYIYSDSENTLAHEYYHCKLLNEKGDPDTYHKDPGFGIMYNYPHGIVDEVNEKLKEAGL